MKVREELLDEPPLDGLLDDELPGDPLLDDELDPLDSPGTQQTARTSFSAPGPNGAGPHT